MTDAPKTGNGWAVNALKWAVIAAIGYLIAVNTWLVVGQFRAEARGEANRLAIESINTLLSARTLAEKAAAAEDRAILRRRVDELMRQQGQERETREPVGQPLPSGE